ncbi:MAG: HAD family hydrolase [Candidatus Moranbacteria bacterium]|nr:HAD family hydrolase [Candidatus Moranbacteria bacterium]
MKKIIFLDRDGTINVDHKYVFEIEKFEFEKNVVPALQLLRDHNFEFIIVTNQSGIGRGYYTEDDYQKFNGHVVGELKKNGINILKSYFSPFHPEGIGKYKKASHCRKPEPGMLEEAEKDFPIDNSKSWIIGDKWADVKCGKNFGIKSILVLRGKAGADEKHKTDVEYIAEDLLDAAKFIIQYK